MDRYEEALERARAGKPMDEVFPELKESEDEKNWNAVLEYVKDDALRVWLEKQKEQKPIFRVGDAMRTINEAAKGIKDGLPYVVSIDSEYYNCNNEKIRIEDQGDYEFPPMNRKRPAEWSDSLAKEMFIKALERAVEQTKKGYELTDCDKHSWWEDFKAYSGINPAEWSEEDKTMLERCISKMANIIPVPGKHGLTNMSFDKHTDEKLAAWLKYLPERFNLPPKQEWSEEDKRMLEVISYKMSQHQGNDERSLFTPDEVEFIDGMEDKLKSLRPQPKVEWSEEDEKDIQEASEYLRDYANNCVQGKNSKLYLQSLADRIESLRHQPHWKPSEEQMRMLLAVLNDWHNAMSESAHIALESLYNDLKKL